jgi:hypothetical protein
MCLPNSRSFKINAFKEALAKLLNIAVTNTRIQNETSEDLRAVNRTFDGEAFGARPNACKENENP